MDKGTTLLKDYIRKTARVLVLSSKLDPKKKSKAQAGFTKKVFPVITDKTKDYEDLLNVIDYKEKFMKVAYPKLEIEEEDSKEIEDFITEKWKKMETLKELDPAQYEKLDKKVILSGYIKLLMESPLLHLEIPATFEQKDHKKDSKEENKQKELSSGKYTWDGSKLEKKEEDQESEDSRDPVSYSNWYAGNVDPEDFHKHKEFLDRQYFKGPIWDGREKPKSIMNDEEMLYQYITDLMGTEDDIDVRKLAKENPEKFDKGGSFKEVHR